MRTQPPVAVLLGIGLAEISSVRSGLRFPARLVFGIF